MDRNEWLKTDVTPFIVALGRIAHHPERPRDPLHVDDLLNEEKSTIATNVDNIRFDLPWEGMRIHVSCTIHKEYFSVTFSIDTELSDELSKSTPPPPQGDVLPSTNNGSVMSKTIDRMRVLSEDYASVPTVNATDWQTKQQDAHQWLYHGIWDAFNSFLLSGCLRDFNPNYSSCFADFRCLIVKTKLDMPTDVSSLNEVMSSRNQRGEIEAARFFKHIPREMIYDRAYIKKRGLMARFTDFEALSIVSIYGRLVRRTVDVQNYNEMVACTMLDRRAIYISSLGPSNETAIGAPNSPSNLDKSQVPIKYLVFVKEFEPHQIGRLIQRINSMGMLRLIALRDMEAMRVASEDMRHIESDINSIRVGSSSKTYSHTTSVNVKKQIGNVSKRCGGLAYRVSRAELYIKTFNRRVRECRIGRIESYQPYDEFVGRRLSEAFDSISRIHERYTKISKQFQSLVNETQLDEIVQLQKVADLVGGAAFTYYLGSALKSSGALDGVSYGKSFLPYVLSFTIFILARLLYVTRK